MSKVRIDYEDVFFHHSERIRYNSPDLGDIELYRNGEKIDIPKEMIDHWEFTGMNNIDFILYQDWTNEESGDNLTKEEMLIAIHEYSENNSTNEKKYSLDMDKLRKQQIEDNGM